MSMVPALAPLSTGVGGVCAGAGGVVITVPIRTRPARTAVRGSKPIPIPSILRRLEPAQNGADTARKPYAAPVGFLRRNNRLGQGERRMQRAAAALAPLLISLLSPIAAVA